MGWRPGEPNCRTFSTVSFDASAKPKELAKFRTSLDLRSNLESGAGWESPIRKRQPSKIDNAPIKLLRVIFVRFDGVCR